MPNDKEKGSGAVVTLRDRYLIFPNSPLPQLATPSAQAFIAEDRRERDKEVFALIVKPGYTPRIPLLRVLKGNDNPGLMTLVEWGAIDWPPANRKVMALVYLKPLGGPVWDPKTGATFKRLDEAEVTRKIIGPGLAALKFFKTHNLTHRAIRPSNMFWAGADRDRMVLGDAACAPPAFEQPSALEPVESALAMPAGRGDGAGPNDVYSFGASVALLIQNRDANGFTNEEGLIRHKMVLGSYSALAGEARMPLALVEILRGTLCDDPNERWDTEAIDLWLSGRRLTPLVPRIEKRAVRSFSISGKDYMTSRELAMGVYSAWDAALAQIGDGKLETWLTRAMDNKDKGIAVANVLGADTVIPDRRMAADITLAKICMLLDPMAPIRYKTLSVMIDGFRWLLPMAMANGGDVRTIAEALMRELPKAWFETREAYNPDNSVMDSGFRTQKGHLDRGSIGSGLERVLYEMNESVPCLSPMLVDDYVLELRDLLPALNAYAKKKGEANAGLAIDRHIAAFVAARANFEVERIIADLAVPNEGRKIMAMINLLAMIQWRVGVGGLNSLTMWLAHIAKPAINGFHNREKRRQLEEELPKVGREGNIVELSRLLDSAEERGADIRLFEEAKAQWLESYRQVVDIETGQEDLRDTATRTGQQIASLISITLGFVAITVALLEMVF
ncbi:MAG TPA: hypothetical protein VKP60_23475 [Magnetospirillaceae bacterium]|nr:hypothetical protein [Magnetospirillaceae bacterium]